MTETVLARAALYNFLAVALGEPPTAAMVRSAGKIIPGLVDAPLVDLQREHTRLFVGPGEGYTPPYASIYLQAEETEKRLLWSGETAKVEVVYRAAGLEIAPGQPRVPDHLALELQFMHHLCSRQAEALTRGEMQEAAQWQRRQEAFLREHLFTWLPRFIARLERYARIPFYPALAGFMLDFLQSEVENLEAFSIM